MNDAVIEIMARGISDRCINTLDVPADELAAAALTALSAAGYVVVPREITPEIACALEDCAPPDHPTWDTHSCKDAAIAKLVEDYTEKWADILATAAPQAVEG